MWEQRLGRQRIAVLLLLEGVGVRCSQEVLLHRACGSLPCSSGLATLSSPHPAPRPPLLRRLRAGGWGSWIEGWCALQGHQLLFWQGCAAAPPPGTAPSRGLELVGAHLRLEKKQDIVVVPAGAAGSGGSSRSGDAPVTLQFPDEGQRDGWMVSLAGVPGLFRCGDVWSRR